MRGRDGPAGSLYYNLVAAERLRREIYTGIPGEATCIGVGPDASPHFARRLV